MSGLPLESRDLTKRYGQVLALEGATFRYEGGRATGYLGPTGGNTTTRKLFTGSWRPTRHKVLN
jgi:ABC-2 type transport system ATP-binding protein